MLSSVSSIVALLALSTMSVPAVNAQITLLKSLVLLRKDHPNICPELILKETKKNSNEG
jgi:hypothetical protein